MGIDQHTRVAMTPGPVPPGGTAAPSAGQEAS